MTPSTETMWLQFVNALAPFGIDPAQFLPASGLQVADWEALNGAAAGQPNAYAMQQWADVMPQWAPEYLPSDMSFYQQYCAFVNAIVPQGDDPARDQVYVRALNQASPLAAGSTGLDPGGGAAILPAYAISPANGTYYGGLTAWYEASLFRGGPTVTPQPAPQVQISLDLRGPGAAHLVGSAYATSTLGTARTPFGWGGPARVRGLRAGAGNDYTGLLAQCQMTFSAMALQVFGPVAPGGWYEGAAVADFAGQTDLTPPLFGPDGVLNLRTGLIAVVYRPAVTMVSTEGTIAQLISAFRAQEAAGGGIAVGSFYWSAAAAGPGWDAGSLARDMLVPGDGTSVTLVDNSNAPKVLGIQPMNLNPVASLSQAVSG